MDQSLTSWVFSSVDYDEHKPLLINATEPKQSLSFTQLKVQVRQLVAGLKTTGIKRGDCVCVNAFNDISYTVLYLGIIGAGAIFTAVNPAYSVHELKHHMEMVTAQVIIVVPSMLHKTLEAADSCGIPNSNVLVFDAYDTAHHDDIQSWRTLFLYGESDFEPCPDPDTTIASYKTSSGTSGLPKAAMISHSYLITQAKLRMNADDNDYEARRLTPLPPMHAFATPIIPASIRQGVPTYIMRRYELPDFVRAIEQYRITETWLAPPSIITMGKSPLATKKALRTLRQIWFGGGGVTYENQLPLQYLMHEKAKIYSVWGMTEAGWITTTNYPGVQQRGSVGSPLRGYHIRVIDDDGHTKLDSFSIGELQILAPHPMLGYRNNLKADREVFCVDTKGRWINSGDIGYIDDQGNVFIVDRKKDLIKVRGWQVSPAEVEDRILQHPEIIDVGVVGIPLSSGEGEAVCAYVVRHCDSCLTREELSRFIAATLANFKCPDEIVFIDSIPRNPTGKILRRLLREQNLARIN